MEEKGRIPQITPYEERETCVSLINADETCILYTNDATIMNRLDADGYKHYSEQTTKGGKIMARQYKLPKNQHQKFMRQKLHR